MTDHRRLLNHQLQWELCTSSPAPAQFARSHCRPSRIFLDTTITNSSLWLDTNVCSPLLPCICLSISSSTIVSFPDAFRISSLPACLTSDTDLARHPYLEIVSCQPHRRKRLRKRCASPLRTQRPHTDGIMTSTSNTPYATPGTSTPTTRPGTPSSQQPTPTTAPADNQLQDDSSKLRTFLSLLRKYVLEISLQDVVLNDIHEASCMEGIVLTEWRWTGLSASQISQMSASLYHHNFWNLYLT